MASPPEEERGGSRAPSPAAVARFRSGPWLIIRGDGPEAQFIAESAREQARDAGIGARVHHIDRYILEVEGLGQYFGLLLALSGNGSPVSTRQMAAEFAKVVKNYRQKHRLGLLDLLASNGPDDVEFYDVGVIQLLIPDILHGRPELRALQKLACAVHSVRPHYAGFDFDCDLLLPYESRPLGLVGALTPYVEETDVTVLIDAQELANWGLGGPGDVEPLWARLAELRNEFEARENKRSEHRPRLDGLELNALELLIDGNIGHEDLDARGTTARAIETRRAMFAGVQREVFTALSVVNPRLVRPAWRNRTPDVGRFLASLCRMRAWLHANGDIDWPAAGSAPTGHDQQFG